MISQFPSLSKAINSAQCNYHTKDHKLSSIVLACKRLHPYLDGKRTVVLADPLSCNALSHLLSCMDAAKEPSEPTPVATPLLSGGPVSQENKKGKSIDSVAILSAMLVEPTNLQQIGNATFADADMRKFVELAKCLSPNF